MGGKSPKTSTQHRRNADNTIKKTFAYFNKALSFYSHFVHIFTVYYKRSRKDAPFYFRLQSPSPKGCRHPFPYWKKNIERKKTDNYLYLVYHSNIPLPFTEKAAQTGCFSCKIEIRTLACNNAEPISKILRIFSLWRSPNICNKKNSLSCKHVSCSFFADAWLCVVTCSSFSRWMERKA